MQVVWQMYYLVWDDYWCKLIFKRIHTLFTCLYILFSPLFRRNIFQQQKEVRLNLVRLFPDGLLSGGVEGEEEGKKYFLNVLQIVIS